MFYYSAPSYCRNHYIFIYPTDYQLITFIFLVIHISTCHQFWNCYCDSSQSLRILSLTLFYLTIFYHTFTYCKDIPQIWFLCRDQTLLMSFIFKFVAIAVCLLHPHLQYKTNNGCFTQPKHVAFLITNTYTFHTIYSHK